MKWRGCSNPGRRPSPIPAGSPSLCDFSLDELKYEYPAEPVPDGRTPQQELDRLTWLGAASRYPAGIPDKVRRQLDYELVLIGKLNYAAYFLTVYDIVRFAQRSRRFSARDAARPPIRRSAIASGSPRSIRRAWIFSSSDSFRPSATSRRTSTSISSMSGAKRSSSTSIISTAAHRAGLAATVICYRPRSAIRDVGKALGLSTDTVDRLAKTIWGWGRKGINDDYIREAGLDPSDRTLRLALRLARELVGFPRHLSQHVGGFVITRGPLHELVPIENAAMEDRTVIEWDKDDLDALGILKIDVLALGMLTCIRKGLDLLADHYGRSFTLATVPAEDAQVYDMLCQGDSLGIFQVESRAQMSMLPRLKPQNFYDLVIEVAIVRPGPIQGDMVHPYLRRRDGTEPVSYPSKALEEVLGKTLGVPLFQEQAMRIAIVAAGFTPEEADKLRRAMATFRRVGTIGTFEKKFIEGMTTRGYQREFAERCFKQIEGFGEYGFPESHAASFALLVYVSAWLKCHYPAVFACALLNSQPMGFYAPAQIVRDARDHRVEVRPVDVNHSDWDCTLEPTLNGRMAMRLGFRQVKGFREIDAARLMAARGDGYATLRDLWRRSGLTPKALETLANADAWGSLGLNRRDALWQIKGLGGEPLPLFAHAEALAPFGHNAPPIETAYEPAVSLPAMPLGWQVIEDYRHLSLSLKKHPVGLLRERLAADGIVPNARLLQIQNDTRVTVSGLVLVRQQPGTASGVIFITLEDETSVANIIVWPKIFERYRRVLLESRLLAVSGKLQKEGIVIHVIADRLIDRTADLSLLSEMDGSFDRVMARADEVRRPGRDLRHAIPEARNFR